uniref:RING-type E3 ubiquitin transferase n=1 Tax=Molossus molossus TaxID=27622 RepID=A0A7J8CZN2_MOLMO|nr:hypothetical protein HJG59_011925 [Molossus molossus]
MLHEAKDRQKFLSDVQYLRDMQHKACLRRQEYRRDTSEKKRDQFAGQETNSERSWFSNGSSIRQSSGEEDPPAEPRLPTKNSAMKCDSKLPAIDQTSVKQKHKSTMTTSKPEKVGPSKPSPGDSSEHSLFCVEYSPYCSVFAFSPSPSPSLSPTPVPESRAALCYFPVSSPTPAETPVLCLPGPRRPSKIYLLW